MRLNYFILFIVTLTLSIQSVTSQNDTTWNGYRLIESNFEGRNAKIVFPKQANENRNWIWRARFWGHEPQTDLALLDLGFHLVYLDVADMYGGPQAVDLWNKYYDYLTHQYQLNKKTVLEGFSRGGLIIYNWASQNPEKVACIYADAPVCDINSWPGGKGRAEGSAADWQKCLSAYGLTEQAALQFKGSPIYTAIRVAEAKIPVLHVCGKVDESVPIEENTYLIEKIFRDRGAPFQLIEKEGIGHHPHSLKNPRPIVRFILENTDPELLNPQLLAQADPSIYLRQNLGNFYALATAGKKVRVAFLGGSITSNGGWRDSVMTYLQKQHPRTDFSFINAGISSMGSVPGAFRAQKDVFSKGKIDLLFVEAAVNDATNSRSPKAQIRGMEGIIRHALLVNPKMDIIMMHFVDPDKMADYNHDKTPEVIVQHEKIAGHYKITSINLAKEVNDRILNGEFTWKDDFKDLHPSPFGQGIYARTIITALEHATDSPSSIVLTDRMIPSRPLDPFSYYNGHYLSIKKSKKRRDWTIDKKWQPQDDTPTRSGFVDVPVLLAEKPGAIFSLNFKGRAIGILVAAGPDVGIVEYSIDGSYYKKIDQFTQWSGGLHLPWLYILEDELANTEHHLVFRITDHKNVNSTGHSCRIFGFAVN
ncbi:MAG: prolyl oligopeptidase family serine peptidase [Saprospiraceae bacterium]|nr:prolyl oligopeptidase family serine peptidase [Saprospiraceae bacterium]